MNKRASELLRQLTYVLYPRRCALCGKVIEPTREVCGACASAMRRVPMPICILCGCGRRDCACGKRRNRFVAAFAAPFYYVGSVRAGILRLKFRREPQTAEMLGREMASFVRTVYAGVRFDAVTYVPMTRREQRARGYNQSLLLAEAVARELLLPCEATLEKLFETRCQRSLDQRRRSGNVFGVFDVPEPQAVQDKRILLVDDLRTTGATLTECAKMLRIRGAREVLCVTAAVGYPNQKEQDEEAPL